MIEIIESRAFKNQFYSLAKEHTRKPHLSPAVLNWYAGSRAYCLGLVRYAGAVAGGLYQQQSPEAQSRLEDALVVPIHLAAEEFSMGLQGGAGAHYRLFGEFGHAVGLTLNELRCQSGILKRPQTAKLVESIRSMMDDPFRGAACIRVFEIVGLKICEAFGNICEKSTVNRWHEFSPDARRYVEIHLEAEPAHNDMAMSFIESLCDSAEKKQLLTAEIVGFCEILGDFWDDLAGQVFFEDAKSRILENVGV